MKDSLQEIINEGETKNGHIEFKSKLMKDVHLKDDKKESLVAQMKYRAVSGDGEALYAIGIQDNGDLIGLSDEEFTETLDVLSEIADSANLTIHDVKNVKNEDGIIGIVTIKDSNITENTSNNIIVGTAGHVDHGKSTLVGTLITGKKDDGEGRTRSYLDVKPHEIERGLSADLSFAVYGFDDNNNPLHMDNPNRSSDRAELVEKSSKTISFVDTVGHKPWLRTTIRGILGQQIDYGLLTVSAKSGPTETTKEHFGILAAAELPVIIAITKVDLVNESKLETVTKDIEQMIRKADKTPLSVERHGVNSAIEEINESIVPFVKTSAVTGQGFDNLNRMFQKLEPRTVQNNNDECKMYIDKIYNISGVGTVVSGTVRDNVETGDTLYVGPINGQFKETTVRSIEIHYYDVDEAKKGQIASFALSDVTVDEIERGMVLLSEDKTENVKEEFEAELVVLNHPTKITQGYEPVVHLETIHETSVIDPSIKQVAAGEKTKANITFKHNEYYIEEGQRFIFREGESKGVGVVKNID